VLDRWRYRISFAWHCFDKGALVFYAILPLPFLFLGFLVYSVHGEYERSAAAARRDAEVKCLAENVYHEARGEPIDGQYAVAEVTMNRVGSRFFPKSVCEVVHEKRWDPLRRRYVGAFSWTELERLSRPRGAAWQQALDVAAAVYGGGHSPRVPRALYYHASYIEPSWARENRRIATIGRHVFYR
jgi:spore germination cell wall hydrolase CwlJ-like protein